MFICLFLFQGQAKVPSKPDWPNTAVIAGGVLGSITIVVLVFLYCYWKKNSKYEDTHFYTWNIPGWKMCKQIHEFLFYFIFQKSKQQHLGTTYGSKLMLFLHKKKKKPYYCWHLQFIVTFVPLERCSPLTIARKAKNHEVGPQDGFSTFEISISVNFCICDRYLWMTGIPVFLFVPMHWFLYNMKPVKDCVLSSECCEREHVLFKVDSYTDNCAEDHFSTL